MQSYVDERDAGYYIAGTRISLASTVHAFQAGESPDKILRSFPMAGPLVKIYGAITFYLETGNGGGVPETAGSPLGRTCAKTGEIPFATG